MNRFIFIFIFTISIGQVFAQKKIEDIELKPKKDIELKIQGKDGTNGSGVAYDPILKRYYTAIAGNAGYPLDVFDRSGRFIATNTCNADIRGLFYNPEYKTIECNTYENHDIMSFGFESNGKFKINYPKIELTKLEATVPNACLNFDILNKKYIAFDQAKMAVSRFSYADGKKERDLRVRFQNNAENINYTSVVYIDIQDGAYGFLDFVKKQVILISPKTGSPLATIQLPSDALTNNAFRFAYANGQIFLYDVDKRSWTGYKIL
ncbi:MAG: hypothetical protein IPN09_16985 [Bacteroidetes bacterium]|nr:hypothetical protein [Bacteroidota bacterium]